MVPASAEDSTIVSHRVRKHRGVKEVLRPLFRTNFRGVPAHVAVACLHPTRMDESQHKEFAALAGLLRRLSRRSAPQVIRLHGLFSAPISIIEALRRVEPGGAVLLQCHSEAVRSEVLRLLNVRPH